MEPMSVRDRNYANAVRGLHSGSRADTVGGTPHASTALYAVSEYDSAELLGVPPAASCHPEEENGAEARREKTEERHAQPETSCFKD
jgi:hypothetical protein